MGRINVNIYNQDEYHDSQPSQPTRKEEVSINKDILWIPIAIFMSIFLTTGLASNRYIPTGGTGPVIINNK